MKRFMIVFVFWFIVLANAFAEPSDFRAQMREASEYVAKKQNIRMSALRLEASGAPVASVASVASRLELDRNTYRPGQHWQVEVTSPVLLQVGKSERQPQDRSLKASVIYDFTVTTVSRDQASIEVKASDGRIALIQMNSRRELLGVTGNLSLGGLSQFPLSLPRFDDSTQTTSGDSTQFTGEDSFSRFIRVTWKKGDPWPQLMQGPAGEARLVASDASGR